MLASLIQLRDMQAGLKSEAGLVFVHEILAQQALYPCEVWLSKGDVVIGLGVATTACVLRTCLKSAVRWQDGVENTLGMLIYPM
ncbi:hypothetical protein CSQ89_11985 [Chitinimonas sp. BJB300]|nr:hypothetical protein CSQ89_11985 [Chitinimonas sp. BJB300]